MKIILAFLIFCFLFVSLLTEVEPGSGVQADTLITEDGYYLITGDSCYLVTDDYCLEKVKLNIKLYLEGVYK